MQRQYETVLVLTPLLTDEQVKEAVQRFKELIEKEGAELIHQENWGLKKLAYPIDKKSTGFYHLFEFKASPEFVTKWETEFKRDERVMRFLTVHLDKYGIEYNEKRNKGELGRKAKQEVNQGTEEEVK
ncbi:MAG: 30S ribosomal protein S6 [Bacteroidetes bacterium SW_10_40_5]|nr:MAG: 30S ribosomal protein S6 [Bacteroidetes bacterium SW_10_40_5]